jgi:predicted porin
MQPNASDNAVTGDSKAPLFRQSFMTFGDKSWGSIKLGKDIGIFAKNAILNDMTLLGVGANANNSGASTTLGGIGTGYIYAAWKGQATYTTPNFNGFQASVGIFNPNQIGNATAAAVRQDRFGLEGEASYSFAQGDISGKVWVSGLSYDVSTTTSTSYTASAGDIGANVNANGFGLTGYYYSGSGVGTTTFGNGATVGAPGATSFASTSTNKRDSDGGYIQLTYVTPFKTKVGAAYGISSLDLASGETAASNNTVKDNERYTLGLYHPLTKHLNLVAEYNNVESKAHNGAKAESNTYSAGAILFF